MGQNSTTTHSLAVTTDEDAVDYDLGTCTSRRDAILKAAKWAEDTGYSQLDVLVYVDRECIGFLDVLAESQA